MLGHLLARFLWFFGLFDLDSFDLVKFLIDFVFLILAEIDKRVKEFGVGMIFEVLFGGALGEKGEEVGLARGWGDLVVFGVVHMHSEY